MVGIFAVARSEWNKLPIFMSYNPFLQTNEITPKAYPFLLMLTTSSALEENIVPWDIKMFSSLCYGRT